MKTEPLVHLHTLIEPDMFVEIEELAEKHKVSKSRAARRVFELGFERISEIDFNEQGRMKGRTVQGYLTGRDK